MFGEGSGKPRQCSLYPSVNKSFHVLQRRVVFTSLSPVTRPVPRTARALGVLTAPASNLLPALLFQNILFYVR